MILKTFAYLKSIEERGEHKMLRWKKCSESKTVCSKWHLLRVASPGILASWCVLCCLEGICFILGCGFCFLLFFVHRMIFFPVDVTSQWFSCTANLYPETEVRHHFFRISSKAWRLSHFILPPLNVLLVFLYKIFYSG